MKDVIFAPHKSAYLELYDHGNSTITLYQYFSPLLQLRLHTAALCAVLVFWLLLLLLCVQLTSRNSYLFTLYKGIVKKTAKQIFKFNL